MEIHRSARRHGASDADIRHAVEYRPVVSDLDLEADPPKVLVVGSDTAGNMLEVILVLLAHDEELAVHAMPLRKKITRC